MLKTTKIWQMAAWKNIWEMKPPHTHKETRKSPWNKEIWKIGTHKEKKEEIWERQRDQRAFRREIPLNCDIKRRSMKSFARKISLTIKEKELLIAFSENIENEEWKKKCVWMFFYNPEKLKIKLEKHKLFFDRLILLLTLKLKEKRNSCQKQVFLLLDDSFVWFVCKHQQNF